MRRWIFLLCVVPFLFPTTSRAEIAGFGLTAGASWGIGNAKSTNTVASRTVNNLAVHALPTYEILPMFLSGGILAEFRIIGQNTEASEVGDTNIKGTGWLLGVGPKFEFGKIFAAGSFDFLGNYSLSKQNSAGQDVSYRKPIGFRVIGGYEVWENISANLNFSFTSYGESKVGDTTSELSGDRFKEWSVRVGGSYHL